MKKYFPKYGKGTERYRSRVKLVKRRAKRFGHFFHSYSLLDMEYPSPFTTCPDKLDIANQLFKNYSNTIPLLRFRVRLYKISTIEQLLEAIARSDH